MEDEVKPKTLDHKACYAALRAHDARFDGRFFVGVSSTGIYCRPVCRVKIPKKENCSFLASAAAAEAAGYRPCLRCRPELAPGFAPVDAMGRIAGKAAQLIEEDSLADSSIAELAGMLGVTDRHLRRAFVLEYGAPPVQYVQTRKLLLAKSLLTDTDLSITEVAMTAGFGSIRRFNDVFKTHYKLAPSRLRRIKNNVPKTKDAITLLLGYRPPYEWEGLLSFLAERAIPGIEAVSGNTYRRTAAINSAGGTDGGGGTVHYGWIAVTQVPEKNSLAVTVASSLLPVLPKILTRVRHLFDLNSSPVEIYEKLSVMNELALQSIQPVPQSIPSAPDLCMPGVRVPGCFDSFEMAVRAVLGQQITVKAARTLGKRFAETLGRKIETPFEDLFCVFPGPKDICNLKAPVENTLGPLGITGMRARSILALAEALIQGQITLSAKADPENEIKKLLDLPGIGTWTAQYIALRALGWPDAFPHTDYGVKKALGGMKSDAILKLSEAWRPWRSYAVINLWNSIAPKKNKEVQS